MILFSACGQKSFLNEHPNSRLDGDEDVDFDVDVDLAQTRFENLDTNGDGVVSLTEFHHQHVLKNKRSADFVNKEWTLMDENQNGVIEPVEFDESLQGQK